MTNNTLNKQSARLGFIGLGLMGSRFLRRLNADGWIVRGWNRTRSTPLTNYGFTIEESLTKLVGESDVLLSSLADDNAVRSVYLGNDGVFQHVQPGTIILEMSTISPALAAMLHNEAEKRGADMLDLPVSGSTPAVDAGTVTLFAGGDSKTFHRCIPIFQSISKQWFLMGRATAGIRMKMVVNLLLGIGMEAIAEAVSLGEHLHLDRDLLLEALPKTAVIAPAFSGKFSKIRSGDFAPQFPLHLMSKDLSLVRSASKQSGVELPAAEATELMFENAAAESGDLDLSAITSYFRSSGVAR